MDEGWGWLIPNPLFVIHEGALLKRKYEKNHYDMDGFGFDCMEPIHCFPKRLGNPGEEIDFRKSHLSP